MIPGWVEKGRRLESCRNDSEGGSGRERPVVAGVGCWEPVLELLPRVTHGIAQGIEAPGDRNGIAALVAGLQHPFPATAAYRQELNLHSVHDPAPSARLTRRYGLQETECNRSATPGRHLRTGSCELVSLTLGTRSHHLAPRSTIERRRR